MRATRITIAVLACTIALMAVQSASAEWQTYMEEDFQGEEISFYTGQANEAFYYVDEEQRYVIDGLTSNMDSLSVITDSLYYYYLEAQCEMLQHNAGELAFNGLLFHYNKSVPGELAYYVFYIYGDGYYGVKRVIGEQVDILVPLTPTDLLDPYGVNILGVDAMGSTFDLYINGRYADTFTDVHIDGGGFGFYISRQCSSAFDNFTVKVEPRAGESEPELPAVAEDNGGTVDDDYWGRSFPEIPRDPERPVYPWEVGVDKSGKDTPTEEDDGTEPEVESEDETEAPVQEIPEEPEAEPEPEPETEPEPDPAPGDDDADSTEPPEPMALFSDPQPGLETREELGLGEEPVTEEADSEPAAVEAEEEAEPEESGGLGFVIPPVEDPDAEPVDPLTFLANDGDDGAEGTADEGAAEEAEAVADGEPAIEMQLPPGEELMPESVVEDEETDEAAAPAEDEDGEKDNTEGEAAADKEAVAAAVIAETPAEMPAEPAADETEDAGSEAEDDAGEELSLFGQDDGAAEETAPEAAEEDAAAEEPAADTGGDGDDMPEPEFDADAILPLELGDGTAAEADEPGAEPEVVIEEDGTPAVVEPQPAAEQPELDFYDEADAVIIDDFSMERWEISTGTQSSYSYFGAAYQIDNLGAESMAISFKEDVLTDNRAAIDVELVDGDSLVGYGLAGRFRLNSQGASYYGLFIADGGEFLLLKVINGTEYMLTDWQATNLVKPGQPNRIALDMRGDTVTAFINGEQVAQVRDGDIPHGGYALLAGPGTLVRFDNLELRGYRE